MNKTIRNSLEIASSINAIKEMRPGLKETEVINYAYKLMANDIAKKDISISVWDDMLKLDFKDKQIEFAETRGISIDDEDYKIVINKNEAYPASYLNRDGVTRAPLAYVTRLVLYYVRLKLMQEKKDIHKNISIQNVDGVELLRKVNEKAATLIIEGNINEVLDFLRED